jgi:hypothetical protein
MKSKNGVIVFIMVFLLIHGLLMAESLSNVYGKVIDAETKEPIPNVYAVFDNVFDEHGRKESTKTNEKGEFEFKGFPADEDEFELKVGVLEPHSFTPNFKYYNQEYLIHFKLYKGKNLFLKPIELKRGVRISGQIKLWDGSIVEKGRISFSVKNRENIDSNVTHWSAMSLVTDGSYISRLLPYDAEIEMEADILEDVDKGVGYGSVKKTIIIRKNEMTTGIDIIIPNIPTEIKGKIVNLKGEPLKDQIIGSFEAQINLHTDNNGIFWIKHIRPGMMRLTVYYTVGTYENHLIPEFSISEEESVIFDITLDANGYLSYSMKKIKYKIE